MRVLYINDHAAQGRWKVQKYLEESAAQPSAGVPFLPCVNEPAGIFQTWKLCDRLQG
jgi:hypothetical protein